MTQVLETLLQLQAHELGGHSQSATGATTDELRKKLPSHILQQYDRLRERGKKGVALVRHGVCGQCHMQVALGLLALLHRQDDIHRCENCGAYLCLTEEPAPVLEMPPRATKPGRRGRPRKLQAHAA
jgi:predicted  nucleic acid-binding Zn-ribbon protein